MTDFDFTTIVNREGTGNLKEHLTADDIKAAGMSDVDILKQATVYNAEIAGLAGHKGEIKPGCDADLILVDGKPDVDISVMYHKPVKVWKSGKLVRGN